MGSLHQNNSMDMDTDATAGTSPPGTAAAGTAETSPPGTEAAGTAGTSPPGTEAAETSPPSTAARASTDWFWDGEIPVLTRMLTQSRDLSGDSGESFDPYKTNVSRCLYHCQVVARERSLEFDGDVGTVAPVLAHHGMEVLDPVLDTLARVKGGSSPMTQSACIDAFILLCTWVKRNMKAIPDAVNLMLKISSDTVALARARKANLFQTKCTPRERAKFAVSEIERKMADIGQLLRVVRAGFDETRDAIEAS